MKKITTLLWALLSFLPLWAAGEDKTEVKIEEEVRKTGYVGESFEYVVTLKSTSPSISNVRVMQNPSFPNDVQVLHGAVSNSRPRQIKEKGKTWYCWTIRRDFIIPSKAGKVEIGASRYVAFIPHEKVLYRDFWGTRTTVDYEEVPLSVKGISFKAKALPASKSDFSGCVGEFKVEGWFPPGNIRTGSDAYVIFKISGTGSLENLKLPNLSKIFGDGCRLKEVNQDDSQSQRDGKLYSEVVLTCIFLPESEDFTVKPLCIKFFNPSSSSYYDACSDELQWSGRPSSNPSHPRQGDAIEI